MVSERKGYLNVVLHSDGVVGCMKCHEEIKGSCTVKCTVHEIEITM